MIVMRRVLIALSALVWAPSMVAQSDGVPAAPAGMAEIILKPGDVLAIRIWPDQSLGGEFLIEETGRVYLPILGEMQAGGISLDAFRATLRDRYGAVLKQPVVTVVPRFPVYVIGAVERPGVYRVGPTATAFDVVSEAGGFTPRARTDRVRLVRDGLTMNVDLGTLVESGGSLAPIMVRSGDRVVIPRRRSGFLTWQNVYYILQTAIWSVTLYEIISR